MHFAEWVKLTREGRGLLMGECAERAKVTQAAWSQYEDAERYRQPRQETAIKIAKALGVPEQEALSAAGYSNNTEIPAELKTIWHMVPAARRSNFLKVVRATAEALSV